MLIFALKDYYIEFCWFPIFIYWYAFMPSTILEEICFFGDKLWGDLLFFGGAS